MNESNVLIITYDMVPHSFTWGGCQRMYYLAKTLNDQGMNTHIFAVRKSPYNTFGMPELKNVHFVGGIDTEYKEQNETGDKKKNKAIEAVKWAVKKADRLFFNEIVDGKGLLAKRDCQIARHAIIDLLRQNTFDVVIISGPPFAIFSLENLVRKLSKATIVLDYRDPWNLWHRGNILCTSREKRLQKKSDWIICTNKYLCDEMSRKFNIPKEKYHDFPNGFSGEIPITEKTKKNIFSLVYAGSIDFTYKKGSYRNAENLMQAFKNVINAGIGNIRIVFVGVESLDDPNIQKIENELGQHVVIIGHVPTQKAKEYILESDAALVLHTVNDESGKYLISGKVYDYIQCKKYILSIGLNKGLHARILNELGIGINVENEVKQIEEGIKECYKKWCDNLLDSAYSDVDIEQFSRTNSMNRYSRFISSIIKK